MDDITSTSSKKSSKQVLKSYNCESTKYENSNHAIELLKGLQSMLKYVASEFNC